jgi:hypothetical protein
MKNKYRYIYLIITIVIIASISGYISGDDGNNIAVENIENDENKINEVHENIEIENNFFNKYIKLAEYLENKLADTDTEELNDEEQAIKEKYFKILRVPENIYELDYNYELVKKIGINTEDGLGGWTTENATEQYPALHYVTKNGDLCFTKSGNVYASKYIIEEGKWIRYGEGYFQCPEYVPLRSIYYKGGYRNVKVDRKDLDTLYIEYNNEKIEIVNYNNFPICFKGADLLHPIINNNDISIWSNFIKVIKIDKRYGFVELGFLFYELENNKSMNEIILPGTDKYRTFDIDIMQNKTTDSQNRIYMRLNDEPYKRNRNGHIMILDVQNDALYNIHHPYYTEINENDDGALTTYVVGEDDNIYFQLVTEQAYYVYKITPLWDSVAETEYNPRFIEYYPELQGVWDEL